MNTETIRTPLEAAIEAAQDFRCLLDIQDANGLFMPGGGNVFSSATYERAAKLLDQARAENLNSAQGPGFQRVYALPIVDVVADQGTNEPTGQLKLFADITVSIAQMVLQLLDEHGRSGKNGCLFEIGVRLSSQDDVSLKQVEGKGDAIHRSDPQKVVEAELCHADFGTPSLRTGSPLNESHSCNNRTSAEKHYVDR